MQTNKNFIQTADLKKGAFTAKAKRAGVSVRRYAHLKEHAKGVLGKEARLAQVFEKLSGNKKKSRMDAEDRKDHGVDEAKEKS